VTATVRPAAHRLRGPAAARLDRAPQVARERDRVGVAQRLGVDRGPARRAPGEPALASMYCSVVVIAGASMLVECPVMNRYACPHAAGTRAVQRTRMTSPTRLADTSGVAVQAAETAARAGAAATGAGSVVTRDVAASCGSAAQAASEVVRPRASATARRRRRTA
jgi:hypothetical protein